MPDPFRQPFAPLFNYAGVSGELETLGPELTALGDLVSYGTHLLPKLLPCGETALSARVVLIDLGRDALAAADGLSILSRVGALSTAQLQLRALFESSAYVQWILSGEREKRAESYRSARLQRQVRWVDGAGTVLEGIAREIGRDDEYARIFEGSTGTRDTPSAMEPLRDMGSLPAVLQSTMDMLLNLFRLLIEEYDPGKLSRFESERATYWSPPYPGRSY
jgi:hypothetical protein